MFPVPARETLDALLAGLGLASPVLACPVLTCVVLAGPGAKSW